MFITIKREEKKKPQKLSSFPLDPLERLCSEVRSFTQKYSPFHDNRFCRILTVAPASAAASPLQPQEGFGSRVPDLGHVRLHLVQHDLLEGGKLLLVGDELLIHFLQAKQRGDLSSKC